MKEKLIKKMEIVEKSYQKLNDGINKEDRFTAFFYGFIACFEDADLISEKRRIHLQGVINKFVRKADLI